MCSLVPIFGPDFGVRCGVSQCGELTISYSFLGVQVLPATAKHRAFSRLSATDGVVYSTAGKTLGLHNMS